MAQPNRVPFDHDAVLALAKYYRFQWEPVQDCHVLLYPEGQVQLRGGAGEIMKRVDGARSLNAIVADLQATFPDAPDLRADVVDFLEVAHGNGWIRPQTV
ncbi:MAG: pyrroloquinoline quinone biosynthesis peptide chaperone PqqD [Burkholderiales bacterium]|nr:pyrroloquinoline quinone biosynthesis peptide chaperone PqqD [Burkholderiales bacterium]